MENAECIVPRGQMLEVTGMLHKEGTIVHLIAKEITDLSGLFGELGNRTLKETSLANNYDGELVVGISYNFH